MALPSLPTVALVSTVIRESGNKQLTFEYGLYSVSLTFQVKGAGLHEKRPYCFEVWHTASGGVSYYIEGSLQFEGKELVDYDGTCFVPQSLSSVLRHLGLKVARACE